MPLVFGTHLVGSVVVNAGLNAEDIPTGESASASRRAVPMARGGKSTAARRAGHARRAVPDPRAQATRRGGGGGGKGGGGGSSQAHQPQIAPNTLRSRWRPCASSKC